MAHTTERDRRTINEQLTAPEANRLFYADFAAEYDRTECCALMPAEREKLRRALEFALEVVGPDPQVVDAGGGTGFAASILAELGVEALVLDLSPAMLEKWRAKAEALGLEPKTEIGELEGYFRNTDHEWDLIVFSSVLHHLEDPESVLMLAGRRLAPGGVILTMFDPTPETRSLRLLRKVDWAVWALFHYPIRFGSILYRRLRRATGDDDPELQIGQRAERHAYDGVQDVALMKAMADEGLEILNHSCTYDARYRVVRLILRGLREPSTFSLMLRRPSNIDS
jgi:SAM-dependent methyltransferase